MSLAPPQERLQLPKTLCDQLFDYRRRVWSIKMIEAVAAAIFDLLVAFLLMFLIDRVWDTPASIRLLLFVSAWVGAAIVPLAFHRWIWRNRRLEQLARLLGRSHPQIGDQLLGVIELVRSDAEQARSRALCEAAIHQVAQDASRRDFRAAVPNPWHRLWGWLVARGPPVPLACLLLVPTRPRTPGGGCWLPGATLHATPSRPCSRCPARWSSRTASRSQSRLGSERRRPGGRARAWCSSVSNIPSRPRSGTGSTSSSSHRRSIPAGSTSASATQRSESGSSRCCVPN